MRRRWYHQPWISGALLALTMLGLVRHIAALATSRRAPAASTMNEIAERYVKLVLRVGRHDADYVDAYYGDPAWKPTGTPLPLRDLATEADRLALDLSRLPRPATEATDELVTLRRQYLIKQIASVSARLKMLSGEKMTFDREAEALYDATPPHMATTEFQSALDELDRLLPPKSGVGGRPATLQERYAAFRERFIVPPARVDAVFRAAITECRNRTLQHLTLPAGERFTVEYVTGKSWSAYNWYKGNYHSVIQVNTELPITIDRAVDLACHEGYPGHHVYNTLLEQTLVRDRGWVEYSVYPLFSPQSLIAEGTANYGIAVAFPGESRTAFERGTLFPIAGLDPATADVWARAGHAIDQLSYAGNEAARQYLDGRIDRAAAAAFLEQWAMTPVDRALQRTKFFDQYRAYVINYNLGKDLVRQYIEGRGGTDDHPDVRWREFGRLLSSPRLPSGLRH